jgi:hypothetical protein
MKKLYLQRPAVCSPFDGIRIWCFGRDLEWFAFGGSQFAWQLASEFGHRLGFLVDNKVGDCLNGSD